jgi:hypothetical protein
VFGVSGDCLSDVQLLSNSCLKCHDDASQVYHEGGFIKCQRPLRPDSYDPHPIVSGTYRKYHCLMIESDSVGNP